MSWRGRGRGTNRTREGTREKTRDRNIDTDKKTSRAQKVGDTKEEGEREGDKEEVRERVVAQASEGIFRPRAISHTDAFIKPAHKGPCGSIGSPCVNCCYSARTIWLTPLSCSMMNRLYTEKAFPRQNPNLSLFNAHNLGSSWLGPIAGIGARY